MKISFSYRRILSLILVIVLLFCSCGIADQALVMKNAPVYPFADNDATPIAMLPIGTALDIVAERDGWAMIAVNGNSGFMKLEDLGTIQVFGDLVVYTTEKASLYETFSTDSKKLCSVPKDEAVLVGAVAGTWAFVRYENVFGFMEIEKLTPNAPSMEHGALFLTAYAAVENASVYNASGTLISKVPLNTQVTVLYIEDGMCKVQRDGVTAYMKQSELSTTKIEVKQESDVTEITPTTYYVKNNGAKVYNTSGEVMAKLPINAALTVDAYTDTLARVSNGQDYGLMYLSDLSLNKVAVEVEPEPDDGVTEISPTIYYVKNDGAKVYNISGEAMAKLPINAALTVDAYTDTLARVSNGQDYGLMYLSDLSLNKVAVEVEPEPEPDDGITEISPTTYYVKNDGAKVYNASGEVMAALPVNAALIVDAYTDKLARVSNGQAYGLMYLSDLSLNRIEVEVEPEPEPDNGFTEIFPTTYYVKNDGAKILSGLGETLDTLELNATVTVIAYNAVLAAVRYGSVSGYMQLSDLSDAKIEVEQTPGITTISPTTYYVKNDRANLLSNTGAVLATLSLNDAVTVTGYNATLALVTYGDYAGLMFLSDLSDKKIETESDSISYTLKYGDKGEAVERIQTRLKELGYFGGTIGGNYLDLTQAAVIAFQKAVGLTADGVMGPKTLEALFAEDAPKFSEVNPGGNNANGSTAQRATGTAKEMDWWTSDIQTIFARGVIATITDVETGIAWHETRTGGTNHADVQPTTAADTAAMKQAAGGWSWNRRAIFVTINGVNYAASMNCMPHGDDSISDNNFDGHHCIHFTNSRTHGTNRVCSLHQNAIQKALKATL